MKKILFSFLLLALLILVTGCLGGNKVVCTGEMEESGIKAKMVVTGYFKGGKLSSAEAGYEFNDKSTADSMCSLLKLAASSSDDKKSFEVKCKGKKIMLYGFENFSDDSDGEMKEMNKSEFIKTMEEENLKCK